MSMMMHHEDELCTCAAAVVQSQRVMAGQPRNGVTVALPSAWLGLWVIGEVVWESVHPPPDPSLPC